MMNLSALTAGLPDLLTTLGHFVQLVHLMILLWLAHLIGRGLRGSSLLASALTTLILICGLVFCPLTLLSDTFFVQAGAAAHGTLIGWLASILPINLWGGVLVFIFAILLLAWPALVPQKTEEKIFATPSKPPEVGC